MNDDTQRIGIETSLAFMTFHPDTDKHTQTYFKSSDPPYSGGNK